MFKTTVKIDGMMCGMCEAHVTDTIRKNFPGAKKASASHSKGEATFISEEEPGEEALRAAIDPTGYTVISVVTEPYEKKGLFHRG